MTRRGSVPAMALSVILLGACNSADPSPAVSRPSPTAATPAPSVTGPPTTESISPIFGPCCAGFPLEPGTYSSPSWFGAPFRIVVPEGWNGLDDRLTTFLGLALPRTNDIEHATHYLAFFVIDGYRGDDVQMFVRHLEADPALEVRGERTLQIGPHAASSRDGRALANPDEEGDDEQAPGTVRVQAVAELGIGFWNTESPRARMRFLLVDSPAGTVLVYVEAPAAGFDAFAARAEELLASLEFVT